MKLTKISNALLKHTIDSYKSDQNRLFSKRSLESLFPDIQFCLVEDAIQILVNDGLFEEGYADGYVQLSINAIRESYQHTKLVKLYRILKEARSWI